jgi:hypothetical protein
VIGVEKYEVENVDDRAFNIKNISRPRIFFTSSKLALNSAEFLGIAIFGILILCNNDTSLLNPLFCISMSMSMSVDVDVDTWA